MKYLISIAIILLNFVSSNAQDSLWLKINGTKLSTEHYITQSENIFTLGRIYNLPLAEIANHNNELYAKGFKNGDAVLIPIAKNNYISDSTFDYKKPLYYKVKNNETLLIIARNLGVRQGLLQTWNNLPTPQLKNDQIILAGWIYFKEDNKNDVESRIRNNTSSSLIEVNNTTINEAENNENQQNLGITFENNQAEPIEQGGAIVFFDPNINLESGNYYGLHATLPKGHIVKVTNPENNSTVFVTIIATLPKVEAYNNAIMAISQNAATALQANTKRIFCKIQYK